MKVLGTEYKVEFSELKNDGECNQYMKVIRVRRPDKLFDEKDGEEEKLERFREVLIHEIIHAFSKESGTEYDDDEALVDWIAFMFPKILKAFNEALEELKDA